MNSILSWRPPHVFSCRIPDRNVVEVFYASIFLLIVWSLKLVLKEFEVVFKTKESSKNIMSLQQITKYMSNNYISPLTHLLYANTIPFDMKVKITRSLQAT